MSFHPLQYEGSPWCNCQWNFHRGCWNFIIIGPDFHFSANWVNIIIWLRSRGKSDMACYLNISHIWIVFYLHIIILHELRPKSTGKYPSKIQPHLYLFEIVKHPFKIPLQLNFGSILKCLSNSGRKFNRFHVHTWWHIVTQMIFHAKVKNYTYKLFLTHVL